MNKKIKIALIITGGMVLISLILMNISIETVQSVDNNNIIVNEIEPAEELLEERDYTTTIKLFFTAEISGIISYEERKIDSRKLIDNPYKYIVELLIQGPESPKLENDIPVGTKVNKIYLEKGTAFVDLSKEFLNSQGMNSIYSIVNTLSEFNEIDNVKFLIDGKIHEGLKEKYVKMDN